MSVTSKRRILICGGGNGAHTLSVLAASRENIDVHVLTLFQDEAERWSKLIQNENMTLTIVNKDDTETALHSKPSLITKDPEAAMEGVDIIFFVVPAFAHSQYFTALAPFIQPNTLILGMPGHAGFVFQCRGLIGGKASICTIASTESLPFVCRIEDFGKHVKVLGFKDVLAMTFLKGEQCNLLFPVIETIQQIIGEHPRLKFVNNYIALNLLAASCVHPPLMYGRWGNWDGKPLNEVPLFYQGVDNRQEILLSNVSNELVKTAKAIAKAREDVDMSDVVHLHDWFKIHYKDQIVDDSSLGSSMRTNKAYDGLLHPMIKEENGYVPNFKYRYTTEDIPFGIVVMKGIAEIAGVLTPTIDEVLAWGQKQLGKEFIVGSKLIGKDLSFARAPQSFGIKTIHELFDM